MNNQEYIKRVETMFNKCFDLYHITPEQLPPGLVVRCIIADDFTPIEAYCKGDPILVNEFCNNFNEGNCPKIERFCNTLY